MSVSREASLALGCVIITNLIVFLAFDSQSPAQAVFQLGTIALWFTLSRIPAFYPVYSGLSKFWYKLRMYLRVALIVVGIYFMIKNRIVRTLLSGYFSFKGLSYFSRQRIRVRLVAETVQEARGKDHGVRSIR